MSPVVPVIDQPVRELGVEIEIGELADLVDPPVLRFLPELVGLAPSQDDPLGLELELALFGKESPVSEEVTSGGHQVLKWRARVLERLTQVAHHLAIAGRGQLDLELAAVRRPEAEAAVRLVSRGHVAGDRVRERPIQLVAHFLAPTHSDSKGAQREIVTTTLRGVTRYSDSAPASIMSSGGASAVSIERYHLRSESGGSSKARAWSSMLSIA